MSKCIHKNKIQCKLSGGICKPENCPKNFRTYEYENYYYQGEISTTTIRHNKRTIADYTVFNYDKTIDCTDTCPTIKVYAGDLTVQNTQLIDCKMRVMDPTHTNWYNIFVIENPKTGLYYIPIEFVKYYNKKKYRLNVIFQYATYEECTDPISLKEMNPYSPLKLYGYSVGKSGLPVNERHSILLFIIQNKIMDVPAIVGLLNQNIHLAEARNDSSMDQAIRDWREDIQFIHDLRINLSNIIELYQILSKINHSI